MALEIEFLDGRPTMEVGQRTRVRVLQQDAGGRKHPMRLEQVAFSFAPVTWGKVTRTGDPAVGQLEVTEVVEPDDLLLAPVYRIEASLTNFSEQTIQPERRVRILATAVEVELEFEVGFGEKWRRFDTQQLKRPIDWSLARTDDPARAKVVVREGRPFLRLASLQDLPAQVSITFPNGETASLRLEGKLGAWEPGHGTPPVLSPAPVALAPVPAAPAPVPVSTPSPVPSAPAASPEPGPRAVEITSFELDPVPLEEPADSEPAAPPLPAAPARLADPEPAPAFEPQSELPQVETPPAVLREEIHKLRRYVSSFTGALRSQPEGETAVKVRERIGREVERVWGLLQGAPAEAKDELAALFQAATEVLPDARRVAVALSQGPTHGR